MKRCAVINDLSGFGKCSLMAAVPVLAVMGCEAHPMLTSVLTLQTGYDEYTIKDLTQFMQSFSDDWIKNNKSFDAVLTGFISSYGQFDIINKFIDTCGGGKRPLVITDPIMADDGKLYDTFNEKMVQGIRCLALNADIITPNISELAIIADKPYSENRDDIDSYARHIIQSSKVSAVVATGFRSGGLMHTLVYDGNTADDITSKLFDGSYSGTGDLMSAVIAGAVMRGMPLSDGVRLASDFICSSIAATPCGDCRDGVNFEQFLGELIYEK